MAAVVEPNRWADRRRRAIRSVFPNESTQTTPFSSLSPGRAGPSAALDAGAQPFAATDESPASHQTRFDRAWHVVTARIALPASVAVEDSFGSVPDSQDSGPESHAFEEALRDVLEASSRLPLASHRQDLVAWHTQQVRLHFVTRVLPLLQACDGLADQEQVLLGSIRTLEAAHRQYLFGLSIIVRVMDHDDAERSLNKFRRDLHAIVGNSMSGALMASLRAALEHLMGLILGVSARGSSRQTPAKDPAQADKARNDLLQLVDSLCQVGLAGEKFQILFAELLDGIMVRFIQHRYAKVWEPNRDPDLCLPGHQTVHPRCIKDLSDWVEDEYSRLAVEVMARMGGADILWADAEKWREIAIGRLATLRIRELFDMVISWPNSEGGIEDLRFAVTTPQRRLQLTDAFSAALQKRLLHSGRSTLEILRTYIAMIRAFHKLDHSRVLLDRVAYSLQLYLCTREDAVRIIVTGLLTTRKEVDTEARRTKLVELVDLMNDPSQYRAERQDEEWDDLTWMPPPVDAGSNYKRRKSEDVIGTLISALGSPEVFIKEFQSIIGQRLLSDQASFEQEVDVLDLLKKRFGEASLQACDVMIKDIEDSLRLDRAIHNTPGVDLAADQSLHARILSRLFWPDMGEEPFKVPQAVTEMQELYEKVFTHLKPSRRLKWLHHLGQATVELELEDRQIAMDVRTYEAAVIEAFAEEHNAPSWSFEDLWMKLQMDEDLLTAALDFWVRERVLRKVEDDRYVVVERLADLEGAAAQGDPSSNSAAAAAATSAEPGGTGGAASSRAATAKSAAMSEKEREKRQVYWQFIVGMLTNSSPAMPLGQIGMMMKMLIADGFPWSNEELQEFLAGKVADGELELAGGKYRLVKK